MKRTLPFISSGILLLPYIAFAAPQNLGKLVRMATDLINPLIGLCTGLAVLAFVWGIAKYVGSAGDEKKKESGRNIMVYGTIALFVLFSFWGIVKFIKTDVFG